MAFFFIHEIIAMQPSSDINAKQNEIITRLSSAHQIDDQDILEATQCLKNTLLKELVNESLKKSLSMALFRLSQVATGLDVRALAKILIEAGANPCHEFIIDEVLIIEGEHSTFSRTAFSVKTDAKSEARGKLKEYLDSLK